MKYFRLSIAAMLLLVSFVSISLVSLTNANNFWSSFTFTISICTLLFAICSIIYRRNSKRAFWTGFSIFGISYFLIIFGPWFDNDKFPEFLSSRLVPYLHQKVRRLPPPEQGKDIIRLMASGQITHNGETIEVEQVSTILKDANRALDVLILMDSTYETSYPDSYKPTAYKNARRALLGAVADKVPKRSIRSTTPYQVPLKKPFEKTFNSLMIVISGLLGGLTMRYIYISSDKKNLRDNNIRM